MRPVIKYKEQKAVVRTKYIAYIDDKGKELGSLTIDTWIDIKHKPFVSEVVDDNPDSSYEYYGKQLLELMNEKDDE